MFPRARAVTFLVTSLAVLVAHDAFARTAPAAASDTVRIRAVTNEEPYASLASRGAWGSLDSLGQAELRRVLALPRVDSLTMAQALDGAVECAIGGGRGREAVVLAQALRAYAIHERSPGPDSLWYARTCMVLGEVRRRRREMNEAMTLFRTAARIRERGLGPRSLDLATSYRYVALVDANLALGHAMREAQLAYDIPRAVLGGADDSRFMSALSVLSAEKNLAGDKLGALRDMERVLAMTERAYGAENPDTYRTRFNVAVLSMLVGDYVRASAAYERVAAYETARVPADTARVLSTLSGWVECLNDLGDYEEAERQGARLEHGWLAAFPPDDRDVAEYQYQRARTLRAVGRWREAEAYYDSAMARQARIGADSLSAITLLYDRARVVRESGDLAEARRWAQRAVAASDRQPEGRASFLMEYGLLRAQCYDDLGRPRDAVALLDRVGFVVDSIVGARSPAKAELLLERSRALRLLGDPRAFESASLAAEMRTEHLRAGARGFAERQALLYARQAGAGLDPLLALAADGRLDGAQRREALARVIESRSLVLDEISARQHLARAARDSASRAILDSLTESRAQLARALVLGISAPGGDEALAAARRAAERFERRLATLTGGEVRANVGAADALAHLSPGDALVSYVEYEHPGEGARTERRVLAFVSRPGADPVVVPIGPVAALASDVERWRADVGAGLAAGARAADVERRCRQSGAALRARAWDPVAAALGGATRAWIVPEGPLHLVDFAALPARDGRWLIESGPLLARLGAERDLAAPTAAASGAGELLAVGGPDFDAQADPAPIASAWRGAPIQCRGFRDVRFGALPGAALEAEAVAARWRAAGGGARVLSGSAALKPEFERLASSAGSLHLATHGFFLGGECAGGGAGTRGIGGLAPAGDRVAAVTERSAENPLRLAGLAFAGANRRGDAAAGADDGVLTAEEIASLDLSHVRDVVLSACDSGVGDVAVGEGVLGLQRAFRIAGARSIVMSLWAVDDRATREWMDAWYAARLGRGLDAAAATRAASLVRLAALRAAHRPAPPTAWAGFVASGAGR